MKDFMEKVDNYKNIIAIIIMISTVFYNSVKVKTDLEYSIQANSKEIILNKAEMLKTNTNIEKLEKNKVNYEVFQMMMMNLTEIKADLKYLRENQNKR